MDIYRTGPKKECDEFTIKTLIYLIFFFAHQSIAARKLLCFLSEGIVSRARGMVRKAGKLQRGGLLFSF